MFVNKKNSRSQLSKVRFQTLDVKVIYWETFGWNNIDDFVWRKNNLYFECLELWFGFSRFSICGNNRLSSLSSWCLMQSMFFRISLNILTFLTRHYRRWLIEKWQVDRYCLWELNSALNDMPLQSCICLKFGLLAYKLFRRCALSRRTSLTIYRPKNSILCILWPMLEMVTFRYYF